MPAHLAAKLSSYNEAAASLAMATVDNLCNESLPLPVQPAKRCLQLGDFFPHPDTKDAFCCVYSLHMVQLWWLICIHFLAKATADSMLMDLVADAFLLLSSVAISAAHGTSANGETPHQAQKLWKVARVLFPKVGRRRWSSPGHSSCRGMWVTFYLSHHPKTAPRLACRVRP